MTNPLTHYVRLLVLASLIFFIGRTASACRYNTDCAIGSVCLRSTNWDEHGVCTGGNKPGNSWDRTPVYNQNNSRDRIGQTCRYDTDCGLYRSCVKGAYEMRGVCQ